VPRPPLRGPKRPSNKTSNRRVASTSTRDRKATRPAGKRVAAPFRKFESNPLTLVKRSNKEEKLEIASANKPVRKAFSKVGTSSKPFNKSPRRNEKSFVTGAPKGVKGLSTRKLASAPKLIKKQRKVETPEVGSTPSTIRLNKFISNAGITSRRKADELIIQGAVRVNGKVVTELGVQVKPHEDHITVNGEPISLKPRYLYLLLNKPKDTITTTSDEKDRTTVLDYVKTQERVYPVGRLDRNTTGVLLLTNDGELTNRLTHPSFEVEREYHVTLDKPLETRDANKIAEGGLNIGDGDVTGPAEILLDHKEHRDVIIKLREGKNREVRRIFEALNYQVEKLDRISFAGLTHRGMGRGESRSLTNSEVHQLKVLVGIESN